MQGGRVTTRAGLLAALLLSALAGTAPAPALAAGPSRAFFGMQTWTTPTERELAMMSRGRVGTFRALFYGPVPATSPDGRGWAAYDATVAGAARQRIRILPFLLGRPGGGQRFAHPRTRRERTAWGSFVTAFATRYGRGGTFWRAHPELPSVPMTAYQVWNEPNLPVYWRPGVDAAAYLRLVRLTRARLRAVDPKASIVLAGLPDSSRGTLMLDFLDAIYAQPGARSLFDVVALHPYAEDAAGVLEKLNRVRALMNRRADRRTPIWVTEIGWSTGGPRSPFRTNRAGQATRIAQTLRALIAARTRLRLGRVVIVTLQDREYVTGEAPWWGPRVGLFDRAGTPKPAWSAFVRFTGGRRGGRLARVAGTGP